LDRYLMGRRTPAGLKGALRRADRTHERLMMHTRWYPLALVGAFFVVCAAVAPVAAKVLAAIR